MEYRSARVVENYQPSERCHTQSQTFTCSKPPVKKTSDKQELSEICREASEEPDKPDIVLNPCHGIICNILEPQDKPLPSRVAVISISLQKPLLVALENSPYVTAAISLSKYTSITNVHFCYSRRNLQTKYL